MKKSLIALAVLAATGAASAQSSVTLYGLADVWFGRTSETNQPTQTVLNSGGLSSSRWGIKGSEDLGGGLKANFLLEQGFALDTGAGTGFSRQSYVGLSGGFGEVKLGKVWTAFDDISGAANPAFDANVLSPTSYAWKSIGYRANPGSTIYYGSNNYSGFSGAFSYSLGENKTNALAASSDTSLHVKYEAGPLYAGFAYQVEKPQGAGNSTKFTRLNATYDLGVAKLLGAYGKVKLGSMDTTEWSFGADYPVSKEFTLSGGFASSKDNTAKGNEKRTGLGLAGMYTLSKRTGVYGGFNSTKIDPNVGADTTMRTLAVGVKHTF